MSKGLALFLATLPLLVVPGNDDMAQLPQSLALATGALLLWQIRLLRAESPRRVPSPVTLPAIALLAWAVLATSWNGWHLEGIRSVARWGAAVLILVLVQRTTDSLGKARLLLTALFVAACGVSLVGLLQHLAGWEGLPQAHPPAGTLANKNVAAAFVTLAFPIGAIRFAAAPVRWCWIDSGALALNGAFLIHAGSRGAWLALFAQALALAGLLFVDRRVIRIPFSKLPAFAIGVALLAWLIQLPPRGPASAPPSALWAASTRPVLQLLSGGPVTAPEGEEPTSPETRASRSVELRLAVWRNSLEMLRERPLTGIGVGNFALQYPRFARAAIPDGTRLDQRVEAAHNDYLQLAVELGAVGMALLGWICVAAFRVLAAAARISTGHAALSCLASGLGLLAIGVLALVSPTLNQPAVLAAAATFLGVATASATHSHGASPAREGQRFSATLSWSARMATASALAAVIYVGHAEIQADRHVLSMARAQAEQDWQTVIREGGYVLRWNPLRGEALFAMATAQLRLGRPESAVPLLERLLRGDPHHASAIGNLGIAHLWLGDPGSAASCFRRVLWLRGDDPLARGGLERLHGGAL